MSAAFLHISTENNSRPSPVELRRREGLPPGIRKADTFPSGPLQDLPETTNANGVDVNFGGDVSEGSLQVTLGIQSTDASEEATKRRHKLPLMSQFWTIFGGSWFMVLIPFVPAGFAVNYTKRNAATIFICNFFAIIPTNAALGLAVEQLGLYLGDNFEGILSMTFRYLSSHGRGEEYC